MDHRRWEPQLHRHKVPTRPSRTDRDNVLPAGLSAQRLVALGGESNARTHLIGLASLWHGGCVGEKGLNNSRHRMSGGSINLKLEYRTPRSSVLLAVIPTVC